LPYFDASIIRIRQKLPEIHHNIKNKVIRTIKQSFFSKYAKINTGLVKFCSKGAISGEKLVKIKLAVKTFR